MASLKYDDVYSRFFSEIEAYDFLKLNENELNGFLCNWLHSASSEPYIRRLFSEFILDDEIMDITYEMAHSVDEFYDKEFTIEVLSLALGLKWITPKIRSIKNIAQRFGSSDEKWYSQKEHLSELQSLGRNMNIELQSKIAEYNSIFNSFLDK